MSRDGKQGERIEQENRYETVGAKPTCPQKLYFEAIQGMHRGCVHVPDRAQAVVLRISPKEWGEESQECVTGIYGQGETKPCSTGSPSE